MQVELNDVALAYPSSDLGELRESNALLQDPEALRARMESDGYLFLRGFHDRSDVEAARRHVLEAAASEGIVEGGAGLDEGRLVDEHQGVFWGKRFDLTHSDAVLRVVESERVMGFFAEYFNTSPTTYNYKWLRLTGKGQFTPPHYDIVYMGRGSKKLVTCWTALGELSPEMGPIAILAGSHRFDRIKETYGQVDVDVRLVTGYFPANPREISETYGGQWLTAHMQPGDVVLFGMYTMHASLKNTSDRVRVTMDTRYQPAGEPLDDRWVGKAPKGHYGREAASAIGTLDEERSAYGLKEA